MKAVTLNRAMRPFGAGDTAWLPDDLARQLIADGEAREQKLPNAPHAHDALPPRKVKEARNG